MLGKNKAFSLTSFGETLNSNFSLNFPDLTRNPLIYLYKCIVVAVYSSK